MGLMMVSTGKQAIGSSFAPQKRVGERVVALAGNPNVGKSTVFNALTGMNQHTGNWPGKTVETAQGRCTYGGRSFLLVDIPGAYSLLSHSAEEEVARDFICFGAPDAVVVVCDATCLERNMNLVLQTLELTGHVVVCVNLMDEARKKKIEIDFAQLERSLGVPVVGASARGREGLSALLDAVAASCDGVPRAPQSLRYPHAVEAALALVTPVVSAVVVDAQISPRWLALRLLSGDALSDSTPCALAAALADVRIHTVLEQAHAQLSAQEISAEKLRDMIASSLVLKAEEVCADAVIFQNSGCNARDRRLDRLLIGRATGVPVMLLLLAFVFWITITGANLPSQLLSNLFFGMQEPLRTALLFIGVPVWLCSALVDGVFRVLAWVVAVMLPPMAIFFPLFTLLEDSGYLPRVAFNLDSCFRHCSACGKQALTMAMGFGCNAVGVTGARIIDSPRERLLAIITNSFVPCNGRFPTLLAIITMFFVGETVGAVSGVLAALLLMGVILVGVGMTFAVSALLSKTILKGEASSFTLELPPYRRPQLGKVIVRSILDRTLFVLGRAIAVAAPAGLLIWAMANLQVGGESLLSLCAGGLDSFARLLGLDGVILLAFILGFPANEIVVPIIMMAYLSTGRIVEMDNLAQLKLLLVNNGWTWLTAVCTMLFSLFHWPCSTTCLTIWRETRSPKWTLLSFAIPTALGMLLCALLAAAARLIGVA